MCYLEPEYKVDKLTRTQRLRFYLQYSGHQKLDKRDKARIRAVLKFFEGRE